MQKSALEKSIVNWMENTEQVDDILVIAIKPYVEPVTDILLRKNIDPRLLIQNT